MRDTVTVSREDAEKQALLALADIVRNFGRSHMSAALYREAEQSLAAIDAARKPYDYRDEAVEVCRGVVAMWEEGPLTIDRYEQWKRTIESARRVVEAADRAKGEACKGSA